MFIQRIRIKFKYLVIQLSLILFFSAGYSQEQPFADEIDQFRIIDSLNAPPTNAILFVGSSSFRMWTDIQDYFPDFTIINRGFGGSSLQDLIHYAGVVIFPYYPKQIVIYCGENDLAASDTVTGEMVAERFISLFNLIRVKLPEVPVTYVSMKPSPSRWNLRGKMQEGNKKIRDFIGTQKNADFVDVWDTMLEQDRQRPIPDIYQSDSLHLNEKGYIILKEEIEPHLVR